MSATPLPQGMLNCSFDTVSILQKSFMPFFKNGGLFVETKKPYNMGDKVVLLLSLPDKSRHAAPGEIAWINPSFGHRPSGVGIAFNEMDSKNQEIKTLIETLLIGLNPLEQSFFSL